VRLREVARTFLVLGSGHVAGKLIALASAALLARVLGPLGLGYFGTAITLLGYVLVASNWGTDAIGIREISARPEQWNQVGRSVMWLRLKLGAAGALVTLVAAWVFRWDFGLVAPLALAVVVFPFRADWLLLAMRRSRSVAGAAVVREVVFLALVAIAAAGGRSLRLAAWAYLIADTAWALTTQLLARGFTAAFTGETRAGHMFGEGWQMVNTSSMGAPV
jgi:O-antigen/teichoic acid export membrane protein